MCETIFTNMLINSVEVKFFAGFDLKKTMRMIKFDNPKWFNFFPRKRCNTAW